MSPRRKGSQAGATLVEVVISIVVIAVAVTAVLGVMSTTVGRSADALVITQGVSVANAYLEEIVLKPFDDPDGTDGEASRIDFDDVDDYNGLVDAGAADQFGNPIPALSGYTVSVAVTPSAALPGVPAGDAMLINVRVQFAPYVDYTLSGYRTRL